MTQKSSPMRDRSFSKIGKDQTVKTRDEYSTILKCLHLTAEIFDQMTLSPVAKHHSTSQRTSLLI